jgi:hypothetical protein
MNPGSSQVEIPDIAKSKAFRQRAVDYCPASYKHGVARLMGALPDFSSLPFIYPISTHVNSCGSSLNFCHPGSVVTSAVETILEIKGIGRIPVARPAAKVF